MRFLKISLVLYNCVMIAFSALDQLMNPESGWLTPQAAQLLVDWQPSPELRDRIGELGRKSSLGTLTTEERAEYREYLDDAEVISLLQAKARRLYVRHNN